MVVWRVVPYLFRLEQSKSLVNKRTAKHTYRRRQRLIKLRAGRAGTENENTNEAMHKQRAQYWHGDEKITAAKSGADSPCSVRGLVNWKQVLREQKEI